MEKTSLRRCNIYIDVIPVADKKMAEAFSREISWDIQEVVRKAGTRGMTAKEIAESFRITPKNVKPKRYKYPISTIYQALDILERERCLESTTRARSRWGHPSARAQKEKARISGDRGRPRKVYTACMLIIPRYLVEEDFLERIWPVLEKHVPDISKKWMEILRKIVSEFNSEHLKDYLPQDEIHGMCGESHEGMEFLRAISFGILQYIEEEVDGWKTFARKNRFMK